MPDNILRIGAEFDVKPIVAGSAEAAASIDKLGTSVEQANAAMLDEFYPAEQEAAAGSDTLAASIAGLSASVDKLSVAKKAASQSVGGFSAASAKARAEVGALDGSIGMMAGGLARVAATSELLGPIIQAAFAPLIIYAFIDILGRVGDAIQKISDDAVGYTKAVQDAEKETVKWSQANEEHSHSLSEAQGKLHTELKETGNLATETFNDKWVKASENAIHATTGLGVALEVLKDPFKLFTPLGTLFTANEGPGNRLVQLDKDAEQARKDIAAFTVEQDKATVSINAAKEAADKAAFGDQANAQVAGLRVEISALGEKERLEKEIASQEAKSPEARSTALKNIGDEYYYKQIELTHQLNTAKQEFQEMENARAGQAIADWQRVLDERAKRSKEPLLLKEKEDKDPFGVEAMGKRIEAQIKYQDEAAKLAQAAQDKEINQEEASVSQVARVETEKLAAKNVNEFKRIELVEQINAKELSDLEKLEDEKLIVQLKYIEQQKAILLGGQTEKNFVRTASPEQLTELLKLNQQIETAQAEHVAKMAQLDEKGVQSATKAATETTNAWLKAFSPIDRAFDTTIKGILLGTETAGRAFAKMGQNIEISVASSIASMAIKWAEHFIVLNVLEKNSLVQRLVTFVTGQAAHKAAQTTADAAEVTATVATQTAKTAAVTAGMTAQTAATVAGEATKHGIEDISAIASAGIAAGLGAAWAFASVLAALPFPVNVATAPGVAAAEGAQILAIGLPKLEKGGILPQDMPFSGHAGEMVLPRPISQGLQSVIPAMQKFGDVSNSTNVPSASTGGSSKLRDLHVHIAGGTNMTHDDIIRAVKVGIRRGQLA